MLDYQRDKFTQRTGHNYRDSRTSIQNQDQQHVYMRRNPRSCFSLARFVIVLFVFLVIIFFVYMNPFEKKIIVLPSKEKTEQDSGDKPDEVVFIPPVIGEYPINETNKKIIHFRRLADVKAFLNRNKQKEKFDEESESIEAFLKKLNETDEPQFPVIHGSKGIVTSCNLEVMCIANIIYLTEYLHIDVPLEVWIEKSGTSKDLYDKVSSLFPNVRFKWIEDIKPKYESVFGRVDRMKGVGCFHIKMMAIVGSQFEKMIWVDSDALLLQKFDDIASQTTTGTLFWHDIWGVSPGNPLWSLLHIEPVNGLSQESGVVYIDKEKMWRALYFSAYMNQRQRMYYSMLWGDKDTFFISCEKTNTPYTFSSYPPFLAGKIGSELANDGVYRHAIKNQFYGYCFVQVDLKGRPCYVHLVTGKEFVLPYLDRNNTIFSVIRTYDASNAHVVFNGINSIKRTFDVAVDHGNDNGQFWETKDALGPFQERFAKSYALAKEIRGGFPWFTLFVVVFFVSCLVYLCFNFVYSGLCKSCCDCCNECCDDCCNENSDKEEDDDDEEEEEEEEEGFFEDEDEDEDD